MKKLRSAAVYMPTLNAGGGAEKYAVAIADILGRQGFSTALYADTDVSMGWLREHFGYALQGVDVRRLERGGPTSRLNERLPRSLQVLVQDSIDARIVRSNRPDIFVNVVTRSELTPVGSEQNLYICHFPHSLEPSIRSVRGRIIFNATKAIRHILRRDACKTLGEYDAILANSRFTASNVESFWQLPADVLYPPCEPVPAGPAEPLQRTIISVGRFEEPVPGVPNKRHDAMIDAFAGLTDLHQQGWRLKLVGACRPDDGAYLRTLRDRAAGLPIDIHPNLSWSDLTAELRRARIYWHAQGYQIETESRPRELEHFGISTVEAMSAGCVPVVIRAGGPQEVAEPVPGAGLWSTFEELQAETRRVARLPESDFKVLSEAAKERARDFSPEAFENQFLRLLEELRTRRPSDVN